MTSPESCQPAKAWSGMERVRCGASSPLMCVCSDEMSTNTDFCTDNLSDVSEEASYDRLRERLQEHVVTLLQGVGENPGREGLADTPKRVAKAWLDATAGYRQDLKSVVGAALFHEPAISHGRGGVVVVRDVEFASTSATHLLPFYGRCHVAYVPSAGTVLGLSKVARLVKLFARRLQTQRGFTDDILGALEAVVKPQGVAVLVEAQHLVGHAATSPVLATVARSGCFSDAACMQDFLDLLRLNGLAMETLAACCQPECIPGDCDGDMAMSDEAEHPLNGTALQRASQTSRPDGSGSVQQGSCQPGSAGPPRHLCQTVHAMLRDIGEDPDRPGLRGAPERYVASLLASTRGYCAALPAPRLSPPGPMRGTPQVATLPFASQCEHHVLPFHGVARLAVTPGPSGLRFQAAELEALVAAFSQRLQIQERLTHQLADALEVACRPAAVLVVCSAVHMCMVARGVEKPASSTVTCASRGRAADDAALRSELLGLLMEQEAL